MSWREILDDVRKGKPQASLVRQSYVLRRKVMGGHHSHQISPIIDAPCGPVRGYGHTFADRTVDCFLGIPYAMPPIGELRFKKPQPASKWAEPRDCFKFGPRSPQNDELLGMFVNIVGKDEAHCLTLNVMSPRWTSQEFPEGRPVMVFIHGGGFSVLSSSNFGDVTVARNLCTKDVVVVTINYRLGVLGFFTTGDELCKGNLGLWDQTLALHWVQDNIAAFGGDPNNVTIFGQSAGGASVDLLTLSPHSRDLFHRVIAMAGSAECDFAIRTNEQQTILSREFATYLGWNGNDDDSKGLLEFINKQPLYKVELGISPIRGFNHSQAGKLLFVPNLDGDFFPRPLSQLRKETPKKSIMAGTTEFEGLFFLALLSRSAAGMKKFLKSIIRECDFGEKADDLQTEIADFYTRGVDPKDKQKMTEQLVHMVGDYAINSGVFIYAKTMSALHHDVFFYSFDYCNHHGFGLFKWLMPFLGATHCYEIRYVLGKGVFSKFSPDEEDKKMIDVMTSFYTNFAKYGNPNEKGQNSWLKHSPLEPYKHLKIQGPDDVKMIDDYQGRRPALWEAVREKNLTRRMYL